MKKKIALIGAGGHCKVIIDLLEEIKQYDIIGIYDDIKTDYFCNYNILGKIQEIDKTIDYFIISIGDGTVRKKIYENNKTLNWAILIHPKSIISKFSKIGVGTVIFAGAVIQTEVCIGEHCIINTNSNIDHESIIGNYCSISPGVTICGNVNIGELTFVGANSTIIQEINVGNNVIIGAGSVIIKNIDSYKKVVGNPGRELLI